MEAPRASRVLVTVGTDHHPFDRLIGWLDRWPSAGSVDLVVQYGTAVAPRDGRGRDFLEPDEFADLLAHADAVVCSGGPGAVMEARAAGLLPIVVPRRSALGEHVDDHQRAFARFMAGRGLITLADDAETLYCALDTVVYRTDAFRIDPTVVRPAGIARIGHLIDDLVSSAP